MECIFPLQPGDSYGILRLLISSYFHLRRIITVAGTCEICGKGKLSGNQVSHSNNKTKKVSKPNIQNIKAVGPHGSHVRLHVCTRCIRSGKVKKVS
jgi:large subunit ribosomal protein L28